MLGWLASRRQEITSVGEGVEKRKPLCIGGDLNLYSHYGKQYGDSLELSYDPAIPLLVYTRRK